MTSEVVVMNSLGVALAADSAATVSNGERDKVFNTADKLFMLSKRHPVGVMVYAQAALLGIPWETIIKMFRRELGNKRFATLEEYGKSLIAYLDHNQSLFPDTLQDRFYLRLLEQMFEDLARRVEDEIYERMVLGSEGSRLPGEIARTLILKERDTWSKESEASCLAVGCGSRLVGRFSGEISKLVVTAFGPFQVDADTIAGLYDIASFVVDKDRISRHALSGLIVAGFGDDEHFPVMQSIEVGQVFEGKLKCRFKETKRIDHDTPSAVIPFADADMVNTFLHGMNPGFEVRMIKEMADLAVNLPEAMVDAVSDLNAAQKKKWKREFKPESIKLIKTLMTKLNEHRDEKHLNPIYQAIANMPKDELGHAAARLVSLNWFQKRMSLSTETVGGPVDVAVISKGDGFIWIERKHYFQPELNRHFFDNYNFSQQDDGAPHDQGEERSAKAAAKRPRTQSSRRRDG